MFDRWGFGAGELLFLFLIHSHRWMHCNRYYNYIMWDVVFLLQQMYQIPTHLCARSSLCLIQPPASAVTVIVAFYDANGQPIVRVKSIYLRYLFNRCLNQTTHLTSFFILLRPSTADQYCFTLHGPSKWHRHAPPKRPQRALHVRRPTRFANSLPRRQMGIGMFVVLSVIPAWHTISNNYSPLPSHADSTITVGDERLGWRNRWRWNAGKLGFVGSGMWV